MRVRVEVLPAILLGHGISRRGGVSYSRRVLEESTAGSEERKKWETEKVIADREEFRKAENLASKMRRRLETLCKRTSFGLVCPESQEPALDALIEEIRAEVQQASEEFEHSTVSAAFVKGRIKSDDQDAAKAIVHEVTKFLEELTAAIQSADSKVIREVLSAAKGLDALLKPTEALMVQKAIETARSAATRIRKEIEVKGRTVGTVMGGIDLSPIDSARHAFLEMSEGTIVAVPAGSARFEGLA